MEFHAFVMCEIQFDFYFFFFPFVGGHRPINVTYRAVLLNSWLHAKWAMGQCYMWGNWVSSRLADSRIATLMSRNCRKQSSSLVVIFSRLFCKTEPHPTFYEFLIFTGVGVICSGPYRTYDNPTNGGNAQHWFWISPEKIDMVKGIWHVAPVILTVCAKIPTVT